MLQTTSRPLPCRSYSVHHSLITQFYGLHSELLKTSLNKWGFRTLGTGGVPFAEHFPTFRQILMHWLSLSSSLSLLEPIFVEDEAITILRKVGNCLPKNTKSIPLSPESSTTALWELHISQINSCLCENIRAWHSHSVCWRYVCMYVCIVPFAVMLFSMNCITSTSLASTCVPCESKEATAIS